MRIGLVTLIALSIALTGCSMPQVWQPSNDEVKIVVSNIVQKVESNIAEKKEDEKKEEAVKASLDAVDYSLLNWCWGGFNGKNAAHKEGVIIRNLSVHGSGMSYAWQSGNCEALGASGHTNADCIAALFVLVDGKWRGGKFEWISTSRLTRSWHNLHGYNGWQFSAYEQAKEVCFVIVSKDGRKRSNVIKAVK